MSVEDAARLDDPEEEVRKRRRAAFAALEEFRMSIRPDRSRMSSVEFIRRDRDAEVHGHWGELADGDE